MILQFEKLVQNFKLKRVGGASKGHQLTPLVKAYKIQRHEKSSNSKIYRKIGSISRPINECYLNKRNHSRCLYKFEPDLSYLDRRPLIQLGVKSDE